MNVYKIFKVIIAGDRCTGKSTLTSRLSGKELDTEYNTTIGVDFTTRLLKEVDTKIHIWDLAGEKRFENIILPYFKSGNILLFVYSIDFPSSLKRLKELYKFYIDKGVITNHKIVIVCNKIDVVDSSNKYMIYEGSKWASSINADFISISSKDNINIEGLLKMVLFMGKLDTIKKNEEEIIKNNWFSCKIL